MRLVRRNNSNSNKALPAASHTNSLFNKNKVLVVKRAPLFAGLSVQPRHKGFVRPFATKRRQKAADEALRRSSLGSRRRMNGMAKLMARAGRGLAFRLPGATQTGTDESSDEDEDDKKKEPDRPFEPLLLWESPHQGGQSVGLPPSLQTIVRPDECGVDEQVTTVQPAPLAAYAKQSVFVPPILAKWLRPHQREGVLFLYQCVMGLKENCNGRGCILADDMGLGKTLQSVTLIYTLLKTTIAAQGGPTAKRIIVICPCSLVKNWANEFVKWLGPNGVKCMALAEGDRKSVERDLDSFVKTKIHNVLVASYECIRTHIGRLTKYKDCCDLLVCDEAHRLKNADNQTSRALNSLPVKRRVLLTGTPMQNDLSEFFAMVDFTNPGILGTPEQFRKRMLFPILRGREPDATDAQKRKMMDVQNEMSTVVNEFILRRVNTLNAQHLPPKLVQVVCCNLTDIQQNMYQHLVSSKDMQHVLDGKQVNCLASIQMLMKLSNHPCLVTNEDTKAPSGKGRRSAAKVSSYAEEAPSTAAPGADGIAKFLPFVESGRNARVHPEWSGKMFVLYRLMREMRRPGNGNDKIVIVSNYTQTLDLIGRMCRENSWGFCRLDGSINMKKRQKMVDEFNDPGSSLVAFLLSSKAGGCGLNLIGGNRLVLFDPDWNPAVDKQAAARCWRDGQKKRCFTYRFLATGTVEEKIFQRQLSKEGLQSVVDDKEQVNTLSTKDLRNLFKLRHGTPSDTHDKLRCERCRIIQDNAEMEALKVLPKQLAACRALLEELCQHELASMFLAPLDPTQHSRTKEEYEDVVKQPMDFGTIKRKLTDVGEQQAVATPQAASYRKVSGFAKDVNRVFSNVMKLWEPGEAIADASRHLQACWVEKWSELVPQLMSMKADADGSTPCAEADSQDEAAVAAVEARATIRNERGEDYQEQIGMPDEENMRHWSHHHSTDTVDDPIFRAAMRGTDSVSFVFGLEVTWSLIQQRQQEEEERLALEQLDPIEEEDDVEEDDEEEDNTTETVTSCANEEATDADQAAVNDGLGVDVDEVPQKGPVVAAESDTENSSNQTQVAVDSEDEMETIQAERSSPAVPKNGVDDVNTEHTRPEHDEVDSPRSVEHALEDSDMESVHSEAKGDQRGVTDGQDAHGVAPGGGLNDTDDESVVCQGPARKSRKPVVFEDSDDDDNRNGDNEKWVEAQLVADSSQACHDSDTQTTQQETPTKTEVVLSPSPVLAHPAVVIEKENSKPVSKEWACSNCTLLNKKSRRTCAACGLKKSLKRSIGNM